MTLEASSRVESPIAGGGPGEISYSDASCVARLRLPYHLVEPTVIAIDIVIAVSTCVIAGFGYNWVSLGHLSDRATCRNWRARIYQRLCRARRTRRLSGDQSN